MTTKFIVNPFTGQLDADGSSGGGGGGDVVGPASSNDGDIAIFDGSTGKLLKDTGISSTDPFFNSISANAGTFNGPLSINSGSLNFGGTRVSDDYAMQITDNFLEVDTVSAASGVNITLPSISSNPAGSLQYVIVKDWSGSASTKNITILPGVGMIDGAANIQITSNYGCIVFLVEPIGGNPGASVISKYL